MKFESNKNDTSLPNGKDTKILNPQFNFEGLKKHIQELSKPEPVKSVKPVKEILNWIIENFEPIDFDKEVNNNNEKNKILEKHYRIILLEKLIEFLDKTDYSFLVHNEKIYLFNGAYWVQVDRIAVQFFLDKLARKTKIPKFSWRNYEFTDKLLKQFYKEFTKENDKPEKILINFQNGTLEIHEGNYKLRPFNKNDFLTYILPFEYNKNATCGLFKQFLDRVLPDKERQNVLQEYLGYVFTKGLKLEKALILCGSGANGKSVLFDVINALFENNITNYSLESLTDKTGYYRAKIENVLINYTSELSTKLETDTFKQLVSNEPIQARLPYGIPYTIHNYAKLVFNCNELPKDVENSHAFFRRFLIIPFDITIPENERDPELAKKIIENDLPGILNWILQGLERIVINKKFSHCKACEDVLKEYKKESNSVLMFIDEFDIKPNIQRCLLSELYQKYKSYCVESGFKSVSIKGFAKRLREQSFTVQKGTDNKTFVS
ncbi:MAG: phage/plasmid primase, P4 family [Patescibacteria group bacterium]|nr:phage/plasmid primase, P4 family [Patescibacteria group bacterium]